jgi:hypothetical protein
MAEFTRELERVSLAYFRLGETYCYLDKSGVWSCAPPDAKLRSRLQRAARAYSAARLFSDYGYIPDPALDEAEFVREMLGGQGLWVREPEPLIEGAEY